MEKLQLEKLEWQIKDYYAKIKAEPKISGSFVFWGGDNDTSYDDTSRGPTDDNKYPIKI